MTRSIDEYRAWRKNRRALAGAAGFQVDPSELHPRLRDDQRAVVAWALRQGRAALFITTGGGKAFDILEWSNQVSRHTGGRVLILAPLAVADQLIVEGTEKWGIDVVYVRNQEEADSARERIVISNYELMHHFMPARFVGVAGDESSFLKNSRGKTRHLFNRMWVNTPYRLLASATPAPNEYDELGNHSQALSVMPWHEMITRWFIRDSNQADTLRLKRHAESDFWKWVVTWAVCMARPSDLGFSDDGFILPLLNVRHESVEIDHQQAWESGQLFFTQALSATQLWANKRLTLGGRMERAAEIVSTDTSSPWVVWVETNPEADRIRALLPEAVEVRGDEPLDTKRAKLRAFSRGSERILVTKLDIAGHGMNWQHCHNTVFASLTYSFERIYQGLKRFHRYGQTHPVNAYMISAATEGDVVQAYRRKEMQFLEMQEKLNAAMRATGLLASARFDDYDYNPTVPMEVPPFIQTRNTELCLA